MPITPSSALYYPYIEITDEKWLRSAALFWDSVRTIVPISYNDPYSSNFARELRDEGALEPVRVSSEMEEIEDLTDTVLDFLTDPASSNVIFDTESHPTERIHPEKLSNELRKLVDIHPEKLPYRIRDHFNKTLNNDGLYNFAPGFAKFYMTLLASTLSKRLGLSLVTESSAADSLAIAIYKGKPINTIEVDSSRFTRYGSSYNAFGHRRSLPSEVSPGIMMDLIVQSISIPETISAKELLKFKSDHREELALFRREIIRLTSEIPHDVSIEALRQSVSDQYESTVVPAMRSLRHSLRAQGWDAALNGFLKVSFFSAAPTSVAILAGMPSSMALIAGAGVSLTATAIMLVNQRHRTLAENPYSYLLSLEHKW